MSKKLLKNLYYVVGLIVFAIYLIALGVIAIYITERISIPYSMNTLLQIIFLAFAFLLAKPILYPIMGWIATIMGLSEKDFRN